MKPVLVLYPTSFNCVSPRIRAKLSRLGFRKFERVDLCSKKWDRTLAHQRATRIYARNKHAALILMGKKVCSALDAGYEPFRAIVALPQYNIAPWVILPHPNSARWLDREISRNIRWAFQKAGVL